MWTYEQASGHLYAPGGELVATGYSGNGPGKNNPAWQDHHDVGPIPCGDYTIGAPVEGTGHGPYVLPLAPYATNDMWGRSGFLMHGDSILSPGTASRGCVILARADRVRVWTSGDRHLRVVTSVTANV